MSCHLQYSLALFLATLIWFCSLWTPAQLIGYDSTIAGEHDGDAPNSSICRRALANVTNDTARCWIARHFRGCQFDSGFFPYLVFQYCTFDGRIIPTVSMVLWLAVLLGAFATIADSFFSPSLIALARAMRMSQNLAGVTLLAFGNGAPDVFSAVTAITTGDPDAPDEGLGLGFLLGSGLLVNTVTAGLVFIMKPFKMSRRPFLKDSLFYLSAVTWSASILIRRRLYYADAIGFLVFYMVYVFTTWIGGTLFHRQREAERIHGLGKFWPPCVQSLINRFQKCSSLVKARVFQGVKCACPVIGKFRSKVGRDEKSVRAMTGHGTSDVTEINCETGIGQLRSDIKPGDNKRAISQTNLPCQTSNGTLVKGRSFVPNPTIKPVSQTLNKPVIEITSPQLSDFTDNIPDMFEEATSAKDFAGRGPDLAVPTPMLPMDFLQPIDGPRQRASSVGSSGVDSNRRRFSSTTAGTSGLTRERCTRTQSVSRRRASVRMSAVGYELPYMVRWIIANRELEEKDLGVQSDLRKSQKWLHGETEDGRSSAYQASNWDSHTDGYASSFGSRKISRICSTINSPIRVPSPTMTAATVEDEPVSRAVSTATRKITLDLVPRAVEEQTRMEGATAVQEMIELGQAEEDQPEEKIWLSKWASKSMWRHFVYYMIPIDIETWPETSWFSKSLQILQIPIFMIFRITIPTVLEELLDESAESQVEIVKGDRIEVSRTMQPVEEEPESEGERTPKERSIVSESQESSELDYEAMHGWCKPLNVLQCVVVPTLWPLLLTSNGRCLGMMPIGNSSVPLFVPFTLTGLAIAIAVHFTSTWQLPPRFYHRPFFATLGFVTSIIWIYALAHELVNSLESLGIVWEISEAILGLSIMALASSIGDIMANCLLARNGYPRIAYAACMGSPLFNLLLGAGMSYTIKIGRSGDGFANLSFTLTQALLFSCLMTILVCNIVIALVCKFHFHRPYGIFLVIVYLVFVTVAILIEVDVIVSPQNWKLATGTE
ncbi:Sodium/potassium/calcium exchanger 6 mitochondrial [Fasciola gigantica]|uniref:Sodium/potassium/calcium exchanger 6 mitochondrial n=1 Tax=Fasciola gigantica TaxID=46835 RepID=A0A504YWF5_FASGI|nr:Sodium/potassium/calcium exchanger 6 mitochondrial [Fasciola gigantica]